MAVIVKTIFDSLSEAEKTLTRLLESKLAAGGNIKKCDSSYYWDNQVVYKVEYELSCFTINELFNEIQKLITDHHSYAVPAIFSIPMTDISPSWAEWINEYTQTDTSREQEF